MRPQERLRALRRMDMDRRSRAAIAELEQGAAELRAFLDRDGERLSTSVRGAIHDGINKNTEAAQGLKALLLGAWKETA